MVASREAAQALPETFVPVDLAITGIVDQVHVPDDTRSWPGSAKWHVDISAAGPSGESE